MFNPYFHEPMQMLTRQGSTENRSGTILPGLQQDDLLILLILYLLFQNGKRDQLWPLMGALIYCLL